MIALDYSDPDEARRVIEAVGPGPVWKIGYQLAYAGGLELVRVLAAEGHAVFLDLKLHDIPNTVEKGAEAAARLGAAFLTAHAYPQTLEAAARGADGSGLKVLGVTVLTSMNDHDLQEAGYRLQVNQLVQLRARQALEAGADGVVVSAHEAPLVREVVGDKLLVVAPGIRPDGTPAGDQKRVVTPSEAIRLGVDHMVVGRPITKAPDPAAAARAVLFEIDSAL